MDKNSFTSPINWILITGTVHSSDNMIAIAKKSGFSYKNFITYLQLMYM